MTQDLGGFYERDGEAIPDVDEMAPIRRDGEVRRTQTLLQLADVRPEERVLDVGCGSGYLLGQVAAFGATLAAVDIAASRLEKASSRLERIGASADLRLGVAEDLGFEDDSFDVVFCSEVLEHLQHPEAGLAEIRRVLKPGGRAILSVPNREKILWVECMHCGEKTSANNGHLHSFDPKSFGALVETAGFVDVACRGTYPRVNRSKGAAGVILRSLPRGVWLALDSFAGSKLDKGNWIACRAFVPSE